jgi:hypothetical protein
MDLATFEKCFNPSGGFLNYVLGEYQRNAEAIFNTEIGAREAMHTERGNLQIIMPNRHSNP